MDDQRKEAIESLKDADPLEIAGLLQQIELYDRESSQKVIDDVYKQFSTGENMDNEILKPVFCSVVDGILEATSGGRAARRKGLTATRVIKECENFSYDDENSFDEIPSAYTEFKNMRDREDTKPSVSQEYDRSLYEDKTAMKDYKTSRVHGEKTLEDEYTGKQNLYLERNNPNQHYVDPTYRKQAQPDHIVPLKQIHEEFKSNYALDDEDIKKIANIDANFAVTSAEINQIKKEMTNEEFIEYEDSHGNPVDEETKSRMLNLQIDAQMAVDEEANKTVAKKVVLGKDEINGKLIADAGEQAKDYAVGNLLLFIVKPIYYELSDSFKHGLRKGVNASSGIEALTIRFRRVKRYVLAHAQAFFGDNIGAFIRNFNTSFFEGEISLFVGIFKKVLRLIKEGIKVFVGSVKILFGKESRGMSMAQKGSAIINLLGASAMGVAGIALEGILNTMGIGEPWSVVLSTMISGIAAALFMYVLNKVDLFSAKAQKRRDRILEIFDMRIADIQEARDSFNTVALETLKNQRLKFDEISDGINEGLKNNSIDTINAGLLRMAEFMGVKLSYSNTEEFVNQFDSMKLQL